MAKQRVSPFFLSLLLLLLVIEKWILNKSDYEQYQERQLVSAGESPKMMRGQGPSTSPTPSGGTEADKRGVVI